MARAPKPAKPPKPTKAERAAQRAERKAKRRGRIQQIRQVYTMTRDGDPKIALWLLIPGIATFAVVLALGIVLGHPVYGAIFALALTAIVVMFIFGRRASASMYAQVEGQPGAAAAVLQGMRGDWRVTPAVAFNRNQDLVHRVVGRPGIVLVGEGTSTARVQQLVTQEKKRVARVAAEVPTYEVLVGDGEGLVPLRRLQSHLSKLPRNVKRGNVGAVENRMRALGATNVPLPKGPLPKGGRIPRGKMR